MGCCVAQATNENDITTDGATTQELYKQAPRDVVYQIIRSDYATKYTRAKIDISISTSGGTHNS